MGQSASVSTNVYTATKAAKLTTNISQVRTQQLYFLRKVHKSPHSIRPIVSCSSGPTEKLSGHLCEILSAHPDRVPSLVKNSQEAVSILQSLDLSAQPELTLVALDVYLSIPQGAGIEMVMQRILHTSPPTSKTRSYKNFLRDSLKAIIKHNHFSFGEGFYKQTREVAMGTKCAPPLANLFLATLEERALGTWKGPAPTAWLRFLDDVLMLWNGGLEQLERFLSHLNAQMSSINFTLQHSQESTVFLDLQIYKGSRFRNSGVLDTKIHIKATNPSTSPAATLSISFQT